MNTFLSLLIVAGIAAAPVSELRGAIPIGIHSFNLHPIPVLLAALVGNMIPGVLILFFLEPIVRWLGRYLPFVHKFVDIWLVRSRKKVQKQIEKYGAPGLLFFVGIPLPMTGVWTGAIGAVLLGLSKKKALLACLGGVFMAAAIILIIDLGFASFINYLA